MYEVVQKLGEYWTELAVYLGYSEVEIGAVARAGGEDLCRQIQMFLRVWWMPDCGSEETVVLLNQRVFFYHVLYTDPLHIFLSLQSLLKNLILISQFM